MLLNPDECIKCAVSLLRDSAYNWWKTLISVVPRERITWDFFQAEFKKKYISQRFIDQKRKEFLELKQGQLSVTEYEREFVRLSQYARECVSTEATMCKHFIEGLNEDIKLLVGILDINEFVVLVERACKAEKLSKEKKKADSEASDERKRSMSKFSQPSTKRYRDASNHSNASFGHSSKDHLRQSTGSRIQALNESSVGSSIELRSQNGELVRIESNDMKGLPAVVSAIKAMNYVRKGYEAYLAYVIDTKVSEKKVESVPVVYEFLDVFPEELPGLPPIREVEFGIELVPGTTLISISPYRMAPTELKELKSQL
ncbi:Gag-Pol polyprotein [Gossypium australe]|uniref:Gag-Pol polyprotein n=1 Tax=Gossypium australe TaxID=47621 RepID=A0A5B6WJF4_9ROSI|nr:Gag-Pol polyprotein [Gossypium australe]